jgi:Leucine-rich repeat (LRR) protein
LRVSVLLPELLVSSHTYLKCLDGRSYAYSTLNLEEKEIQELGELLRPYVHLSTLNLSKNDIRDVSTVAHLPHLLTFNASGCAIKSLDFISSDPAVLRYL